MKAMCVCVFFFFKCSVLYTNKTTSFASGTKIPSFSVSEIKLVTPDGSQQKMDGFV